MRMAQWGSSLWVQTPAKVNLHLEILGRRADGFHDLETILLSIGLYDTLLFSPTDENEIVLRYHPGSQWVPKSLPTDENNLVVRAAGLLRSHLGITRGAQISLWKRIPVEAGLGGGSSDAAATLVALNRLWQADLPAEELHALAAQLGSDVNFFLDSSRAAIGSQRGEVVRPIPVSGSVSLVLVKPPSGLSTGAVFRKWDPVERPRDVANCRRALALGSVGSIAQTLHNALQRPAVEINEDVGRVLATLRKSGAVGVAMSGSGTSCFGLCRSPKHARRVAAALAQQRLGFVTAVSNLV